MLVAFANTLYIRRLYQIVNRINIYLSPLVKPYRYDIHFL